MSLLRATQLLNLELPEDVEKALKSQPPDAKSFSTDTFVIRLAPGIDRLEHILTRRLAAAPEGGVRSWVGEQLSIIRAARNSGTTFDLWQGYFVRSGERIEFTVHCALERVATHAFPLD